MEPMTCVARFDDGAIDIWTGTQGPALAQTEIAKALDIAPDKVSIYRPFAGGGFGRRFFFDYCLQAALIAREFPGRPVKLIWSREEDTANDYYRPAVAARLRSRLTDGGMISAFSAQVSAASILEQNVPGVLKGGPDRTLFGGLNNTPYEFGEARFVWHEQISPVRIGMWRAVSYSQNAFFMESFMDECAHSLGQDPAQFRLEHAQSDPRMRSVIEKVMDMSGWSDGRPLGIAAVKSYGSYVAQVVELSDASERIQAKRVWCAVDCGMAVDPGGVIAQMESGIIYGLTAALYGEITFENGRVDQSNFHDYRMLSLLETPEIETAIVDSGAALGGVGEPGLPPIAPALANAIFAKRGMRLRELPFKLDVN